MRNYRQSLVVDATADYGHVQPHASPRPETACRRWLHTSRYDARISLVHATVRVVAISSRYSACSLERTKNGEGKRRALLLFESVITHLFVNRRPYSESE